MYMKNTTNATTVQSFSHTFSTGCNIPRCFPGEAAAETHLYKGVYLLRQQVFDQPF
jgi:hypothetical protein